MTTTYETPRVGGPAVEHTWTLLAAEIDGEPQPQECGRQRRELVRWFAFERAAAAWALLHAALGYEISGPTPLATFYHGPTDSPSNAWSVTASRELGAVVGPPAPDRCPGCDRVMSRREAVEQGACNDCSGGAYDPRDGAR